MSGLLIMYAELLLNLGQVSVSVSLPSRVNGTTKAIISPDKSHLIIRHEGERETVTLPAPVDAPAILDLPASGTSTKLEWRLRVHPGAAQLIARYTQNPDMTPWSAGELQPGAAVVCRRCGEAVIPAGRIKEWKDLPSENWAEMMDFWHCHKPHEDGDGNDPQLAGRGYGANSTISAQAGVGLVDVTSFLVAYSDYVDEALDTPGIPPRRFCSAQCRCAVGIQNAGDGSMTLFKWEVDVRVKVEWAPKRQPSLAACFSTMLMSSLSRSGSGKSILVPLDQEVRPGAKLLHVWLFHPNVVFASNQAADHRPSRAVKVLFLQLDKQLAETLLSSMTSAVQEIRLPRAAIRTVHYELQQSNRYLPPSDRTFQSKWNVGLLKKWSMPGL